MDAKDATGSIVDDHDRLFDMLESTDDLEFKSVVIRYWTQKNKPENEAFWTERAQILHPAAKEMIESRITRLSNLWVDVTDSSYEEALQKITDWKTLEGPEKSDIPAICGRQGCQRFTVRSAVNAWCEACHRLQSEMKGWIVAINKKTVEDAYRTGLTQWVTVEGILRKISSTIRVLDDRYSGVRLEDKGEWLVMEISSAKATTHPNSSTTQASMKKLGDEVQRICDAYMAEGIAVSLMWSYEIQDDSKRPRDDRFERAGGSGSPSRDGGQDSGTPEDELLEFDDEDQGGHGIACFSGDMLWRRRQKRAHGRDPPSQETREVPMESLQEGDVVQIAPEEWGVIRRMERRCNTSDINVWKVAVGERQFWITEDHMVYWHNEIKRLEQIPDLLDRFESRCLARGSYRFQIWLEPGPKNYIGTPEQGVFFNTQQGLEEGRIRVAAEKELKEAMEGKAEDAQRAQMMTLLGIFNDYNGIVGAYANNPNEQQPCHQKLEHMIQSLICLRHDANNVLFPYRDQAIAHEAEIDRLLREDLVRIGVEEPKIVVQQVTAMQQQVNQQQTKDPSERGSRNDKEVCADRPQGGDQAGQAEDEKGRWLLEGSEDPGQNLSKSGRILFAPFACTLIVVFLMVRLMVR